ncbi:MAG: hypothetical protein NZM38_10700 [Cytophagales bacterium]|nr:hypothetical protein [Cytophagales bacterium]MDW8385222.1 hypothetical protein [Flammeovirgaceae bacterium]
MSEKIFLRFFILFTTLYVVIHLFTLDYFPLPWFDETYMADIALSWRKDSTFTRTVALHDSPPTQELIYGPVYFVLVGMWLKWIPFSLWGYRFFVLVAGLLVWILVCRMYWLEQRNIYQSILFAILFALNPLFNRCLHEGRMDFIAIVFALVSWLGLMLFQRKERYAILYFWISSLAWGFSLLTTPRAAVILLPICIWGVVRLRIQIMVIWMLLPIGMYTLWVLYAFGNVGNWWVYYQNKLAYTKLITPVWYVPRHEIPVVLLVGLALVSIALHYKKIVFQKDTFLSMLLGIVLFQVFVHDAGVYSVLILPHYYWILGVGFLSFTFCKKQNLQP